MRSKLSQPRSNDVARAFFFLLHVGEEARCHYMIERILYIGLPYHLEALVPRAASRPRPRVRGKVCLKSQNIAHVGMLITYKPQPLLHGA